MALIPVKIDRTSKPPLGTPLRTDGHWSVIGLVGAWALNEASGTSVANLVTGKVGATGAAVSWTPTGCLFNGLAGARIPLGITLPVAFSTVTISSGSSVNSNYFLYCSSSTYISYPASSSNNRPLLLLGSSNYRYFSAPYNIFKKSVIISSVKGQSQTDVNDSSLYIDGVKQTVVSTTTSSLQASRSALYLGSTTGGYTGECDYISIYGRCLSENEIIALGQNPWQIFEPETVWIEVGGSGGATLASSASWRIAAAIGLETAWRIKTLIDQAGAWRIYTKGDATSSWKIAASSESATAWKNYAQVGSDTAWKLKAAAESNTAWRILLNQLLQNQTGWSIRAEQALNTAWRIKAMIDSATAWAVLTAMPSDTAWQILTQGAYITNTSWRIKAASEQATAWRLKTSLLAATDWTIINGMSEATAWDILGSVDAGTGWRVHNATSSTTSWRIDSELLPEPVKIFLAPGRQLFFNADRRVLIITAPAK